MKMYNRFAVLWLMLLGIWPAYAVAESEVASLNMRDVDIRTLVDAVSEVTGKNFLLDPRVKGQVTLVSAQPMSKEGLYEVFQSVLQVHGFAAVPSGPVIKIVPDTTAQQAAVPMGVRGLEGDQLVTQVIPVEHVAAAALVPVLKPLIQGQVAAYAPSNVLIVSDRAANVTRLEEIIRRVDLDDSSEIEVFRLRNAAANEVARVVNSLMGTSPQARGRRGDETVVAADERTNSLFISGDPSVRLKIRSLIAHLDTPLEHEGNTQVVFLKYAKAVDMAVLLQSLLDPQSATVGGEVKAPAKGGKLVQADEYNNALIISASPDVSRELKAVIRQLDIRRAQVLVEAVIAEVSTDLSRQLGVQFAVGDQDGSSPVAVSNLGSGDISLSSIAGAIANETYSIGTGAILGFADVDGKGLDWAVLVNALAGDAATNILSTPTLLATDNQEAQIVVGQNVPFVTGSYSTGGDSGSINNPFQTIQRQDVGITLKVTPQINEGNSIRLDLEQEVSSLAASAVSTADVVTNKRAIKTSVTVEDGQIIVLGGLIEDTYTDSQQKVPLLGDLPALGQLFRYDSSTKVKKNLMVFLRTVILSDPELAASYSGQKYSLLRSRQFETGAHQRGLAKDEEARLPVRLKDLFERPTPQPTEPEPSEPPKAESGWGVDWE